MQRLWTFRTGDPEYVFETPTQRGTIRRRVTPAPYRKRHPVGWLFLVGGVCQVVSAASAVGAEVSVEHH